MDNLEPQPSPESSELPALTHPLSEHPLTSFVRFLFEIIKTVVVVLVFALLIRYFLVQPFVVDGSSMRPSFHDHEYLLVEKLNFIFHHPQRGEVIVFKYPLNPSFNYIKRVIGVPGDRVVISKGKVTIYNNQNSSGLVLKEPYLDPGQSTTLNGDAAEHTWLVDQNSYFVLGDNRDHSDDSRSWGFVPAHSIVGKVWLTIYPPHDFGLVHHAQY